MCGLLLAVHRHGRHIDDLLAVVSERRSLSHPPSYHTGARVELSTPVLGDLEQILSSIEETSRTSYSVPVTEHAKGQGEDHQDHSLNKLRRAQRAAPQRSYPRAPRRQRGKHRRLPLQRLATPGWLVFPGFLPEPYKLLQSSRESSSCEHQGRVVLVKGAVVPFLRGFDLTLLVGSVLLDLVAVVPRSLDSYDLLCRTFRKYYEPVNAYPHEDRAHEPSLFPC
jgi:hypothetical protein